jgi:hypothetical protein
MSRTYRKTPEDAWFRKPKTARERRQNNAIETDSLVEYDYNITKQNRRHRFIPSEYDDLPFADN